MNLSSVIKMVDVCENVLNEEQLKAMENKMLYCDQSLEGEYHHNRFSWHFKTTNLTATKKDGQALFGNENHFMFTHIFFRQGKIASNHYNLVKPLVEYVEQKYDIKRVLRIKANLYTNQHMNIKYGEHMDQSGRGKSEVLIGVFNLNSCNGGTVIAGKTYPSAGNHFYLFDNILHHGISQTDTQARVMINFNFERNL